MVTNNYTERYLGKWYSVCEAQNIESDLQRNAYTGESHVWRDRSGNTWDLSGSYKPEVKLNRFERRKLKYGGK